MGADGDLSRDNNGQSSREHSAAQSTAASSRTVEADPSGAGKQPVVISLETSVSLPARIIRVNQDHGWLNIEHLN